MISSSGAGGLQGCNKAWHGDAADGMGVAVAPTKPVLFADEHSMGKLVAFKDAEEMKSFNDAWYEDVRSGGSVAVAHENALATATQARRSCGDFAACQAEGAATGAGHAFTSVERGRPRGPPWQRAAPEGKRSRLGAEGFVEQ